VWDEGCWTASFHLVLIGGNRAPHFLGFGANISGEFAAFFQEWGRIEIREYFLSREFIGVDRRLYPAAFGSK
jgi:hypothetical protein